MADQTSLFVNDGEDEKKTWTVTQAMNAAKRGLEKIRLKVIGEVSEFNDKPGYKAVYFTIADDKCSMPCIMWRERYRASGVELSCGALVELSGAFTCYAAKGRMQFSVTHLECAGEGSLRIQVAELARKLQAEGLMDPARKRKLCALPCRIGVVTSPRGKAVHDVIRTLRRRYPLAELALFGVPVEGASACRHLIEGLHATYAADPPCQVILLVRGGGSYEDLMPFNDEELARCIAQSPVPIVTGIGHEPDNTIADMVADRRCSTPTAAAEAVSLSVDELAGKINNATRAIVSAMDGVLFEKNMRLSHYADRPVFTDEHYLIAALYQDLDYLSERLVRSIPDALAQDAHALELDRHALAHIAATLTSSQSTQLALAKSRLCVQGSTLIEPYCRQLKHASNCLHQCGITMTSLLARKLCVAAARLEALSPLRTLSRGFAITYGPGRKNVVKSVARVTVGDEISVQLKDGFIDCTVENVERKDT